MEVIPEISVILPVFNGKDFVREAVESILAQTFTNFELIIINDASTDETPHILAELAGRDPRVTVLTNASNLRIAGSLNRGLSHARGHLVARMDADDYCVPERLAEQHAFMRANPGVTVCGSAVSIYEVRESAWVPPEDDAVIRATLLFENCIYHPTVIFRRSAVMAVGGYDDKMSGAEDYDLWCRLSTLENVRFANLRKPLVLYRRHPTVDRAKYRAHQRHLVSRVLANHRRNFRLDFGGGGAALHPHEALSGIGEPGVALTPQQVDQWLTLLSSANEHRGYTKSEALDAELRGRYLAYCLRQESPSIALVRAYFSSRWAGSWLARLKWSVIILGRRFRRPASSG